MPRLVLEDGQAWLSSPTRWGTRCERGIRPRPADGSRAADGMGTARAWCVLAPNPSPMTLDGTNTWVIAEPGSPTAARGRPGARRRGPPAPGARARLRRGPAGDADRADPRAPRSRGGRGRFAELAGAPGRRARPGATGSAARDSAPGTVLDAGGCELRVVATPGHTADSLSLLLTADGALLTGDTVLGRGTTVIADDGSLGDYLRTLDELRALADEAGLRVLLPGHGPLLADPAGVLDYYIAHRRERLDQVRAALAAGARTPGRDRRGRLRRRGPGAVARRRAVRPRPARLPRRRLTQRRPSGRACAGARRRGSGPSGPRSAASPGRRSRPAPC